LDYGPDGLGQLHTAFLTTQSGRGLPQSMTLVRTQRFAKKVERSPRYERPRNRFAPTLQCEIAVRYRGRAEEKARMKKLIAITIALVAAAGSLRAADAKGLYDEKCAKCHGTDGKGDTKLGKKTGAKDYSDPKVQAELTDEAAFKAIKDGFKAKDGTVLMKPTEGVSDADIKGMVAHMRTFKK
jgi:cytochrome c553